ncbi:MAG TPA: hypothetical protein VMM56_14450 [Planctomycetaceae bacterium]|nr:hypothetical protein [Planctomycetaceae bacterium]
MKGPGHRYDIDIRRLWECPECGKQIRLPAQIVHRQCTCHEKKTWMRLVPNPRIRTFPPRERINIPEVYDEPEELIPVLEDQPIAETFETTPSDTTITVEEPAISEPAIEDSISSDFVIATPEDDRDESTEPAEELAEPSPIEPLDSVETSSDIPENLNQPIDGSVTEPRKKRRRKRNRNRDRKKNPNDVSPQNSDSTPSPPAQSTTDPPSDNFGSGV